MGAAAQLKNLYNQILNGTAPSGAASSSGDISQMIKYIIANGGATPQNRWGLPGRFRAPIDVTTSGSASLTERINYFKNLTVAAGHTLTAVAGGTIIVVEEKLTIAATGVLSANALGGKGASAATNAIAAGGYGAGLWNYDSTTPLTVTMGQFLSSGAISSTNPFVRQRLQPLMAAGGAGGALTVVGTNGAAYPVASRGLFAGTTIALTQWELVLALMELMLERPTDDATAGAIGGGGGGAGGSGGAGTGGAGGTVACRGASSSAAGAGGGGGSGFGGGGGGAGGSGGTTAGGVGGRGGGVLIVIAREVDNGGTISANGGPGTAGDSTTGEGGGGGGGAVVVAYEHVSGSGVGTVQANGGSGSNGAGNNGGAGGAGLASSFDIRSGA